MTNIQKTLIAVSLAAAVGVLIYEARVVSSLREQVESLQQQQAPLADPNEQLTRERDEAARQLAALREENERLNRTPNELLRLRNEVGLLRRQTNELARLRSEAGALEKRGRESNQAQVSPPAQGSGSNYFAKESLVFAGYAEPELALQSFLWAMSRSDVQTMSNTYSADFRPSPALDKMMFEMPQTKGFRIVNKIVLGDGEVEFRYDPLLDGRESRFRGTQRFKRIGNEWKAY